MWFQEKLEDCEILRSFEANKMKILVLSISDDDTDEDIKEISLGEVLVRDQWPHQF